jgi:hypothetical protein
MREMILTNDLPKYQNKMVFRQQRMIRLRIAIFFYDNSNAVWDARALITKF